MKRGLVLRVSRPLSKLLVYLLVIYSSSSGVVFLFFFAFSISNSRFSYTRFKLGLIAPESGEFGDFGEDKSGFLLVGELLADIYGKEIFLILDPFFWFSVRIRKG